MTRHSKNNTAGSAFTYHERQSLNVDYGSKRQRLGAESMLQFDSCTLCQSSAREPMVCEEGHLYCKECVLSDLVVQKSSIQRQTLLLQKLAADEASSLALAKQKARERVLEDFERSQSFSGSKAATNGKSKGSSGDVKEGNGAGTAAGAGVKRKRVELEEEEISSRIASYENEAALEIEREAAIARKAKLPNFWLPSLTPSAAPDKLKAGELKTLCRAVDPPHPMNLKGLMKVSFKEGKEGEGKVCACCERVLNNGIKIFALKCSHILCSTCIDKLCGEGRCAVCDVSFDETAEPAADANVGREGNGEGKKKKRKKGKGKGIIELKREGTGYASGGRAEAKKEGVSFQA
ncbi:hypothetical protein BT69DRAFT_1311195 [Atractiella rhizophila]|nr:hypothetical protein BT69DRAFT_1311195 [Atractiella rhizophila]